MYSSARSVLYLSTMKPHDPFVVDDEADDCPPPLPVVAQDGEAEEEDDDGKPQSLGSRVLNAGCALIVTIVLILLVVLFAAIKALNSVLDFMSHLGH